MNKRQTVQYTVRSLPKALDERLRERAHENGKSLNEIVVEALKRDAGIGGEPMVHHDLDALIGSWKDDPIMTAALSEQDQVDAGLWK